jgi:hypothetical protein
LKTTFKVGDRVVCVKAYDGNKDAVGKAGTVKHATSTWVRVEFDEPISGGHTCSGSCKYLHGWCFAPDEGYLRHAGVREVKRPAKVGEWVLTVDSNPPLYDKGETGKVVLVDDDGTIKVQRSNVKTFWIHHQFHLVLDGYQPEPEIDPLDAYEWVDGYKGFDKNLCCRGFQYEVGKEYDLGHEESVCSDGFHFCKTLEGVQENYYSANGENRFCKVRGLVKKGVRYDGKYCARKIVIVEEVTASIYWSGKVVCTENAGLPWTVGKVYAVSNGEITNDEGDTFRRITSVAYIHDQVTNANFIEYKGEQQ